jgi:hypothetical protein
MIKPVPYSSADSTYLIPHFIEKSCENNSEIFGFYL